MLFGVLYFSFLMSLLMEEIKIVGEENQTVEEQKLITQLRKLIKEKRMDLLAKILIKVYYMMLFLLQNIQDMNKSQKNKILIYYHVK